MVYKNGGLAADMQVGTPVGAIVSQIFLPQNPWFPKRQSSEDEFQEL
jgi:hypothetical protein